jgi:hypothetical protein
MGTHTRTTQKNLALVQPATRSVGDGLRILILCRIV